MADKAGWIPMIGRTLSHYRIIEKLGAGGMGEVYRARDEHLGRDVALKVLPAGTLADEAARKRFRKEALALAKLNHSNIGTIHDFDTQEGVDFLVMEHVAGVTLSDKLAMGPLAEKEVVRLGGQVAEALEEAHERGVVHRDLKPGNVMVTAKGQVKVLDFGLAKLVRPEVASATATTESFTETQAAAGTLPYMAPEQLRGEPVDARTDIHALGAVLYEMATGRRPFQEKLATALADDILHQPPPPPGRLKPDLSSRLEDIILKSLEKEPENRYQSAKELAVDLRRLGMPGSATAVLAARRPARRRRIVWAAGLAVVALLAVLVGLNVGGLRERLLGRAAPGQITSIAVLPLDNMMGDAEQDYFVEGMHEALITELSKIGALKVISRTSAMRYKDSDKSVPEIARELGVDAVIEGSVLRAGDRVRVTAQLVDAATDEHLWAENFDRDLGDILALHSEVAQAIAREVKVAVTPEEETRLADARPVNPEAYEAYLKGRYFWNRRTAEDLKKGLGYFQQAVEKDPGYALGYAGLADSYNLFPAYGVLRPREAYPKAKTAALKALEIDEMLAEAHTALAFVKWIFDWDWSGAENEFMRAIELNPNYATAHQWYGTYLGTTGRPEEAIAEAKRAQELDPFSLIINSEVGERFFDARRYDDAIQQLRKTLELEPDFVYARNLLALAYTQEAMHEEAIAECREVIRKGVSNWRTLTTLGYAYAVAGDRAEALKILDELGLSMQRSSPYDLFQIAMIYTALGDKDQAFAWLEKAYQERYSRLITLAVEPAFDPLRSDPRFQALLRRMNFPE